jgi:oligopeptide/dipeptide ABC transporter ATP-binding protein
VSVTAPHVADSNDVPVLQVENLTRHFRAGRRSLFGERQTVKAVDGISFDVKRGEVFGIVGESGCGKSTASKAILNIHPPQVGTVRLNGIDLTTLSEKEWREIRRKIQYVFQDPLGALDPRIRVIDQVIEPLKIHGMGTSSECKEKASKLLHSVGLLDDQLGKYPHELSGGQRQRVVLARALILEPQLLICDEPISALDVSIQAQVVTLLQRLRAELGLTILFISHDLSIVRYLCDRVAVMYLGQIVELASVTDLFESPQHPYTRALISAIPIPEPGMEREHIFLEGEPPSAIDPPPACRFHVRCPFSAPLCGQRAPEMISYPGGRMVACHLVHGEIG